ncbi:MAG TPA: response regulator [Ktedonobacteraceae bacterium]
MAYRYSGEQHDLFRPVEGAEFEVSQGERRLRIFISGKRQGSDHFCAILAENVRRWGYEVEVITAATMRDSQRWEGEEGDIVLYDMDALLSHTEVAGSARAELASTPGIGLEEIQQNWPRARLKMLLSSRSVSRRTLERLGVIALLYKPFDMRVLERYLRVFQRLLYPPFPAEETGGLTRLAIAGKDLLAEGAEGSGEVPPRVARILIADDQEDVTWGIRQCLIEQENQRYHYEVKEVHDGLALLEQCVVWQPHCVVTDLLMPRLNGYQVMRCLASAPGRYRPAFVVISALMRHEIPVDHSYLQDQTVRYVNKPFDVEDLLKAVEQELTRISSQNFGRHGG